MEGDAGDEGGEERRGGEGLVGKKGGFLWQRVSPLK